MKYDFVTKKIKPGTESTFGVAKIYPLKDFLEMYHLQKISPADGYVMGITVGGRLTNLYLSEWGQNAPTAVDEVIALKDLENENPKNIIIWWRNK